MALKTTAKNPATSVPPGEIISPPPKATNLHSLDAVRREMARVYRDMRTGKVPSQDGARLVYVLGELRKMFEVCELEKRIAVLEGSGGGSQ